MLDALPESSSEMTYIAPQPQMTSCTNPRSLPSLSQQRRESPQSGVAAAAVVSTSHHARRRASRMRSTQPSRSSDV